MQLQAAWQYVLSDLHRYVGDTSPKALLKAYVKIRSFRYQLWLRLTKVASPAIRVPAIVMHSRLTKKFGIQIPREAQIGYGLYIAHNMAIVMHPSTRIGNNCNLSQFTTIGANKGNAAVIGDNVYIGPNVCIVEAVKIASNVTIGAGSVVVKDLAEGATYAGNPAREISRSQEGRFVKNRWPISDHLRPAS